MSRRIETHKLDSGSFVVSENGTWIPGAFDSDSAARLAALTLSDAEIIERLGPIYHVDGEDRPVTFVDVQAAIQ